MTVLAKSAPLQRPVESTMVIGKRFLSSNATPPKRFASSAAPTPSVPVADQPFGRTARRLWKRYCNLLESQPLATKVTTAAVIFTASDLATQSYTMRLALRPVEIDASKDERDVMEKMREVVVRFETTLRSFDWNRALSGGAFGVMGACYLHSWWGFLERFAQARFPRGQHRLANTLVKVAIDQGLSAPVYYYAYYILTYVIQTLPTELKRIASDDQHSSKTEASLEVFSQANERAKCMIWPTMMQHWQLWPAIHALNFYFVPLHQRVMVQNLILSGWSGYLSYLNNDKGLQLTEDVIEV